MTERRFGFLLYFISCPCNAILMVMQQPSSIQHTKSLPAVSIIVAMTSERVIGNQQGLPWHLPEDLQLFKRKTLGKTVIMGRKTHQSIGQPLPGRHNIVLSRAPETLAGVQVCRSFIKGLTEAARHRQPIFVIGGAELYKKALPVASELHISWVEENAAGDIHFPSFDLDDWRVLSVTEYSGFNHIHYQRINT
jgi:dihydrofolate reductase